MGLNVSLYICELYRHKFGLQNKNTLGIIWRIESWTTTWTFMLLEDIAGREHRVRRWHKPTVQWRVPAWMPGSTVMRDTYVILLGASCCIFCCWIVFSDPPSLFYCVLTKWCWRETSSKNEILTWCGGAHL